MSAEFLDRLVLQASAVAVNPRDEIVVVAVDKDVTERGSKGDFYHGPFGGDGARYHQSSYNTAIFSPFMLSQAEHVNQGHCASKPPECHYRIRRPAHLLGTDGIHRCLVGLPSVSALLRLKTPSSVLIWSFSKSDFLVPALYVIRYLHITRPCAVRVQSSQVFTLFERGFLRAPDTESMRAFLNSTDATYQDAAARDLSALWEATGLGGVTWKQLERRDWINEIALPVVAEHGIEDSVVALPELHTGSPKYDPVILLLREELVALTGVQGLIMERVSGALAMTRTMETRKEVRRRVSAISLEIGLDNALTETKSLVRCKESLSCVSV